MLLGKPDRNKITYAFSDCRIHENLNLGMFLGPLDDNESANITVAGCSFWDTDPTQDAYNMRKPHDHGQNFDIIMQVRRSTT